MSQRFSSELRELLPEVDAFVGLDQVSELGEIIQSVVTGGDDPGRGSLVDAAPATNLGYNFVTAHPSYIPDYDTPRFRLTPTHSAYVKIAERCNHPCSFCVIPRMRGTHRSRRQDDVVSEARALIADGVSELNLISQDSTYYGLDLRQNHSRAISSPNRFNAAVKSLP